LLYKLYAGVCGASDESLSIAAAVAGGIEPRDAISFAFHEIPPGSSTQVLGS
jgi:hypothetical protein